MEPLTLIILIVSVTGLIFGTVALSLGFWYHNHRIHPLYVAQSVSSMPPTTTQQGHHLQISIEADRTIVPYYKGKKISFSDQHTHVMMGAKTYPIITNLSKLGTISAKLTAAEVEAEAQAVYNYISRNELGSSTHSSRTFQGIDTSVTPNVTITFQGAFQNWVFLHTTDDKQLQLRNFYVFTTTPVTPSYSPQTLQIVTCAPMEGHAKVISSGTTYTMPTKEVKLSVTVLVTYRDSNNIITTSEVLCDDISKNTTVNVQQDYAITFEGLILTTPYQAQAETLTVNQTISNSYGLVLEGAMNVQEIDYLVIHGLGA